MMTTDGDTDFHADFHAERAERGFPPELDAVLCPRHPNVALAPGGECGRCGWKPEGLR